ncbi:hypothetical protein BDQ12DRAFT_714682 [Crucibulum laeve]|uniref:F-box domain-containing protein n=1 Tax=Crucibulum laeve TaxID=68775 RepID=A0A5C3LS78_9AGAR|nr:hypothetical protein BDQ12DRAFT_714682 [Crucibulum laeve]
MTSIPGEIIDLIIDEMGYSKDSASLEACSTVCRHFLKRCRKHIFSNINLTSGRLYQRFRVLLFRNPEITAYITEIHIVNPAIDSDVDFATLCTSSFPIILGMLSRLRNITLQLDPEVLDWHTMPSATQIALQDLFQRPSLISICLRNLEHVPNNILSRCIQMKHLELSSVGFKPLSHEIKSWDTTFHQMESLALSNQTPTTAAPLIHAMTQSSTSLRRLSVLTCESQNLQFGFYLMKALSNSIESIDWGAAEESELPQDIIGLESLPRLQHISFLVTYESLDPLGIIRELLDRVTVDINIQYITLKVEFSTVLDLVNDEGNAWKGLDAILSRDELSSIQRIVLTVSDTIRERLNAHQPDEMDRSISLLLQNLLPAARARGVVFIDLREEFSLIPNRK